MKKVAIVLPSFSTVGGAEIVAANQAQWLRRQGVDVRIVTGGLDTRVWGSKLDGIRIDILPAHTSRERLQCRGRSLVRLLGELWRALRATGDRPLPQGVGPPVDKQPQGRSIEIPSLLSEAPGDLARVARVVKRYLDTEDHAHAIARIARHLERLLGDTDVALAHNYPMAGALARARIPARKVWYCHEPNRVLHLCSTRPTIAARIANGPMTDTLAEREFLSALRRRRHPLGRIREPQLAGRDSDVADVAGIDVICVNSRFTRQLAEATYGSREYRLVYPMMDLPAPGPPRTGLRREPLRILVHSRLEAPKNVDTVIRGVAHFTRTFRRDATVDVVGEGSARLELKRLVHELRLESIVRFHGFVPDEQLVRVYEECDLFALLPVDEPFGMVFPEAMVRGLIAVGPDHGGPSEILDGGRFGFTCDPFSPTDLAQVFERIFGMADSEVDSLRREAERSCRDRFGMERVGAELLSACALGPNA